MTNKEAESVAIHMFENTDRGPLDMSIREIYGFLRDCGFEDSESNVRKVRAVKF